MATEDADGYDTHFRSVTVTAIAALAGVVAALISMFLTTGAESATAAAKDQTAQLLVLAVIPVQLVLLRGVGLLKDDFGAKDFLFVLFMTFSMWFITFGVVLTTGMVP